MFILAESFGEKMAIGGSTAIIGLSIVFLVLFALIGILILMDKIMQTADARAKSKGQREEWDKLKQDYDALMAEDSDDAEVVAAIAAAIACVYADESGMDIGTARASFVVKSIRKV